MPFDLWTMNANLETVWDVQRRLDEARVGLGAFESARAAIEGAGIGRASSWIKDFDASVGPCPSPTGLRPSPSRRPLSRWL